jgi:hypothetical protein
MYRITVTFRGTTETLLKSKELEQLITQALNSRAFHFEESHRIRLEKETSGKWNEIQNGKGLELFNPSERKGVKA